MWKCLTFFENCLFCSRSRGGSTQKDGVPGVCVPRPLWVLQVPELSIPHHPHPTRKRLHLDPHRTHTSPHCQRVFDWQQLTGLWYGLNSVAFKQTFVYLCNIIKTKMVVNYSHHFRLKTRCNLTQKKSTFQKSCLHSCSIGILLLYLVIKKKMFLQFFFCLWLFKNSYLLIYWVAMWAIDQHDFYSVCPSQLLFHIFSLCELSCK